MVAVDLSGARLCAHTGGFRYARGVDDSGSPPWAGRPVAPAASSALHGRETETVSPPWADPPELVAVRASVNEAQERIDRATRQLELAAEHEADLQANLAGPSGQGVPPVPSPERQAAELEATAILLKAELRAAKILNDLGNPSDEPGGTEREARRELEGHLAQLADLEATLAAIGRQLARHEILREQGPSRVAPDSGPAQRRGRPVGQSVPVPLFRRPRRGNSP